MIMKPSSMILFLLSILFVSTRSFTILPNSGILLPRRNNLPIIRRRYYGDHNCCNNSLMKKRIDSKQLLLLPRRNIRDFSTTTLLRHNPCGYDDDDDHHHHSKKITIPPRDTLSSIPTNPPSSSLLHHHPHLATRRTALLTALSTSTVLLTSTISSAKSEVDVKSGELFSPKSEMLFKGGSDAARGIRIRDRSSSNVSNESEGNKKRRRKERMMQSVYETRFIAYLSRFLLTFDPAARAWWKEESTQDPTLRFAAFAESVEVGLTDYFLGPYGSYASVSAAKAGLNAAKVATSQRSDDEDNKILPQAAKKQKKMTDDAAFWTSFLKKDQTSSDNKSQPPPPLKAARQGILNLLALLQARYTQPSAKIQLAILFSFIPQRLLQPTDQITALLGEAQNATISGLELFSIPKKKGFDNLLGGYSSTDHPTVTITPPPALASRTATARAITRPTSRILRIDLVDGGEGYIGPTPPMVTVQARRKSDGGFRQAQACALMDGAGGIDSLIVLDPGFGYDGDARIVIASPPPPKKGYRKRRTARAAAVMEYGIVELEVVDGGSGYVPFSFEGGDAEASPRRPRVEVSLPAVEPDWFVSEMELSEEERKVDIRAVTTMNYNGIETQQPLPFLLTEDALEEIKRDPTMLLPIQFLPQYSNGVYTLPPELPPFLPTPLPSPLYRAYDPLFGGVGTNPVTKNALTLSFGEYSRLALSGAICTIMVRTLLNPLELVKTKLMLGNDEELLERAREIQLGKGKDKKVVTDDEGETEDGEEEMETMTTSSRRRLSPTDPILPTEDDSTTATTTSTLEKTAPTTQLTTPILSNTTTTSNKQQSIQPSTLSLLSSLLSLRGPPSLFQSADITFLASLIFGSFGFGATELFRRAFTLSFFPDAGATSSMELITYLAAAGVACVVTCAVAAPFEVVRVRSMGLRVGVGWRSVLEDIVMENRQASSKIWTTTTLDKGQTNDIIPSLKFSDILPLYSGFPPIVSRELPFAITKFLAFDIIARLLVDLVNNGLLKSSGEGATAIAMVQVGVGPVGLAISAISGAFAGICGAVVSHPADLLLTLTSSRSKNKTSKPNGSDDDDDDGDDGSVWDVVNELLSKDGGIANLFVGLPARAAFFFLVIGLQFFLYDFVKTLLNVGSDDLTLVLDVFYAVRQGLVDMDR